MDTRTGEIMSEEMVKQLPAEKAKFMKMIPQEYAHKLEGLNRADRRKFYREHKKEFDALAQRQREEGR